MPDVLLSVVLSVSVMLYNLTHMQGAFARAQSQCQLWMTASLHEVCMLQVQALLNAHAAFLLRAECAHCGADISAHMHELPSCPFWVQAGDADFTCNCRLHLELSKA